MKTELQISKHTHMSTHDSYDISVETQSSYSRGLKPVISKQGQGFGNYWFLFVVVSHWSI